MSWIIVTEITTPAGVETWAETTDPIIVERLTQFHYNNGVQDMQWGGTHAVMQLTSTFYDEEAHTNLKNALATNPDYQLRTDYNQSHGITQRNIYEGLVEGYDQSKHL